MRRRSLIRLTAVLAALALGVSAPAALGARRAPLATGIELAGTGRAVLSLRGALLGGLERGQLTIVDLADLQGTEIIVLGYDWKRLDDTRTTTYGGEGLRFRVFRGSWRVRIQGAGIAAAAAGRGSVGLGGEGRYSVDGGPFEPWPARYQTLRLGD
jgi:hypothetical protein